MLGNPYSSYYLTITSIKSLTALAIASLDEDPYGRVSKDVPTVIRTYCSTIQTIEAFVNNLPPHWTDVYFHNESGDDRRSPDVDSVVSCLRTGLGELIDSFGIYASELGMSVAEMNIARKIASVDNLK